MSGESGCDPSDNVASGNSPFPTNQSAWFDDRNNYDFNKNEGTRGDCQLFSDFGFIGGAMLHHSSI